MDWINMDFGAPMVLYNCFKKLQRISF